MFDFSCIKLTTSYILSIISEEAIFAYYTGEPVDKKLRCSHLREDKHPTCGYYRGSTGRLRLKDFATGDNFNCFEYVKAKFSCSYNQALKIIATDFGLINDSGIAKNKHELPTPPVFEKSGFTNIRVEIKAFSESELKWWGDFGISEKILKKYKVFSCKNVFLNNNIISTSSDHCPIYGYYGGKKEKIELWKIYFPKRKRYRFLTNYSAKFIQGYKQLPNEGKVLVITKSLKDVMCLYSLGIPAIAPNSETLEVKENLLETLQSRFKYIAYFYDSDLPGIHNMRKIKKKFPDLFYFWIPRSFEAKDISDFYKKYGREKTLALVKKAINLLKE